ncbi:26S protease regulatory subunit [bacterium]|nr:MAG: 26S protease regulatory subunit [bacterium]
MNTHPSLILSPSQHHALEGLELIYQLGNIGVLSSDIGCGRSTVLKALQERVGGQLLTMADFFEILTQGHPLALEENFARLVGEALQNHDCVIVDDLHLLNGVVGSCNHFYQRRALLDLPLTTLSAYAIQQGKKLFFGCASGTPQPIQQRCYHFGIADFAPADYEHICQAYLDSTVTQQLDFNKIHRFAPKLNAHQIKGACVWLRAESQIPLTTERFIDYLRSQRMTSNVALSEVRQVDLGDLKGIDDIIACLEANIVLPLENDELASEFNLSPKRGVLLAGPPGTGKTTVGRALAHRLKGKFFLIDGTFIAGTQNFYGRIQEVFEAAKVNAPSVIFIDDGDAIFEGGEEQALYRYLLTMLDGLESESVGRVCVMMTAMNVGDLPPALVRSGRIELWLETRLPDEGARTAILEANIARLPSTIGEVDVSALACATEGLTGADLNRLCEDGKLLFAYDKSLHRPERPATDYFLQAIETVNTNKQRYATIEAATRRQKRAGKQLGGAYLESLDE